MDVRGEMRTLSGFGEATAAGTGTSVTFKSEGSLGYGYVDGDGTLAQFRNPWFLALGPDAASLALTDNSNRRIRRVLLGNGSVSTLAGSGEASTTDGAAAMASFVNPKGLAFGGDGTLFIVDGTMVRRLTAGQVVSTLVGKGATASALRDPHGLAAHPLTGTIYVADYPAKQVKSVSPAGSVQVFAGSGSQSYTDGIGTAATFVNPYYVSLDPTLTALYVADNAIRRIELATAQVTTLAGTNAPGSRDGIAAAALFREPFSVAASPFSGIVYVVDGGAWGGLRAPWGRR
jgi:DNA-binding beta-propeller fold protein YncE